MTASEPAVERYTDDDLVALAEEFGPFGGVDRLVRELQQTRAALAGLLERWDQFTGRNGGCWGNQEDAYYDLAKHAQRQWADARAALPQAQP